MQDYPPEVTCTFTCMWWTCSKTKMAEIHSVNDKNNFHEQTGTEFFVTSRFFISSVYYSSMGLEKRNTLSLFSLSLYLI